MTNWVAKWGLVFSNLSYLLPAVVTGYQMSSRVSPEKRMAWYVGLQLIVAFVFVGLVTSWSYHECFGLTGYERVSSQGDQNKAPLQCGVCEHQWYVPQGWLGDVDMEVSRVTDHLFALLTMLIVLLYVIPLKAEVRSLFTFMSLAWISWCVNAGQLVISAVPHFLAGILFLSFWWETKDHSRLRNVMWTLGLMSGIVGLTLFIQDGSVPHIVWHVLTSLSAALRISQQASNKDEARNIKHTNRLVGSNSWWWG